MASLPTLDELKALLGIPDTDTSKDDAITKAFEATIAIVERYCSRGLDLADEVEELEPVATRNRRVMLYRFPIQSVQAVELQSTSDPDQWSPVTGWRVFKRQGALEWGAGGFRGQCCGAEPVLRVTYTGGYPDDEWPADLVDAITRAFLVRWTSTQANGVVSVGGGVRSVSVDGLAVSYTDPVNRPFSEASIAPDLIPPELVDVAAMLDPYRDRMLGGV